MSISGCRDTGKPLLPTVNCFGRPVQPTFAAADRYPGEWVIPRAMGQAHLVVSTDPIVRTSCGQNLAAWFSAAGLCWDGCLRCVAAVLANDGAIVRPMAPSVPGSINAW